MVPESVRNFKVTAKMRAKPLFKVLAATENITKNKKKGFEQINKLLERMDLDRPLIFKEKFGIIWNEQLCEPLVVQDLATK